MGYEARITFPTRLSKVLAEEGIKQNELFFKMEQIERPKGESPVSKATICNLCSGKQKVVHTMTMHKILRAINLISKRNKYTLNDIMEEPETYVEKREEKYKI